MEKKIWIGTTANKREIYIGTSTVEHMMAHPNVRFADIREAIGKADYIGPFKMLTIDLERVVGKDGCVKVPKNKKAHMLYRIGREGKTPCLFESEAEDEERATSLITIGICTDDDGKETLFTAFYGQLAPKEPWDSRLTEEERKESIEFWANHAVVVNKDMIDWDREMPM